MRTVPCPRCGGPSAFSAENKSRPFCSERCKLQDLARWADGAYRIPGEPQTDPEQPDNAEPHTER